MKCDDGSVIVVRVHVGAVHVKVLDSDGDRAQCYLTVKEARDLAQRLVEYASDLEAEEDHE